MFLGQTAYLSLGLQAMKGNHDTVTFTHVLFTNFAISSFGWVRLAVPEGHQVAANPFLILLNHDDDDDDNEELLVEANYELNESTSVYGTDPR
jgi:hypothetical protein